MAEGITCFGRNLQILLNLLASAAIKDFLDGISNYKLLSRDGNINDNANFENSMVGVIDSHKELFYL